MGANEDTELKLFFMTFSPRVYMLVISDVRLPETCFSQNKKEELETKRLFDHAR